MVVPSANGYDLLKEHAYYEYGNKEFQSVLNFDYSFAIDQFVSHKVFDIQKHYASFGLLITLMLILSLSIRFKLSHKYKSTGSITPQTVKYDIETGPPSLSRSNTATPTNSPDLAKDSFKVKTYRFDDYQPYKQA